MKYCGAPIIKSLFYVCLVWLTTTSNIFAWTNDASVNTPIGISDNNEQNVKMVSDGAGGTIIVWDYEFSVGDIDLHAQRLNAQGIPQWGSNGIVVAGASLNQLNHQIVSDGNGGVIVVWEDYRGGSNSKLYAQKVTNDGNTSWPANGVPLSSSSSSQLGPKIVHDALSDGAYVTWSEFNLDFGGGGSTDIYAQKVNDNGSLAWAANGEIVIDTISNHRNPEITLMFGSTPFITWVHEFSSTDYDIRAQSLNSNGSVAWDSAGVVITAASGKQENIQLTTDAGLFPVIVWEDGRNESMGNGDIDIYMQKINFTGTTIYTAGGIPIITNTSKQLKPQVVYNGEDSYIVIWHEISGLEDYVKAQLVQRDGTILWNVNTGRTVSNDTGNFPYPSLVADGNNGAIVTWNEYNGFTGNDILAQRLNGEATHQLASGWLPTGNKIASASNGQTKPLLVSDDEGGAIIAWEDFRRGTFFDIYAQQVNKFGNLGQVESDSFCVPIKTQANTIALICL